MMAISPARFGEGSAQAHVSPLRSRRAFRRALTAEHDGTREPDRILVADDDPDWLQIIGSSLKTRFPHAHIDLVGDGAEAIQAFESSPYSVVLVDLEMPEVDGAKLTASLRSSDKSSRTPIIVLTAAGGPKEWQRLSAIGADAFLVKPVNADDVELVLKKQQTHAPQAATPPRLQPGRNPRLAPAHKALTAPFGVGVRAFERRPCYAGWGEALDVVRTCSLGGACRGAAWVDGERGFARGGGAGCLRFAPAI